MYDQITCPECGQLDSSTELCCTRCSAPRPAAETTEATATSTPQDTPAVMARTDGAKQTIRRLCPWIISAAATFIVFQFIGAYSDPTGFVYRLFIPDDSWFQRIVPIAIVFMVGWVIVDMTLRGIGLVTDFRHLESPRVLEITALFGWTPPRVLSQRLDEIKNGFKKGRVYRSIRSLLRILESTDNTGRAHELFKHLCGIEVEHALGAYSTARIFIWAMPILGFIGTVVGIGMAVGEFSSFIGGNINDLEVVKAQLSEVAGGLSYAFNTTLLGLLASLTGMLLTSAVQKSEEKFLMGIDRLGLDLIAGQCDSAGGGETPSDAVDLIKGKIETIDGEVARLTEAVALFSTNLTSLSTNLATCITAIPDRLAQHETTVTATLSDTADRMGRIAVTMTDGMAESARTLTAVLEAAPEQITNQRQEMEASFMAVTEAVSATMSELTQACQTTGESLKSELMDMPRQVALANASLGQVAANLDTIVGDLDRTVGAGSRQLTAAIEKISETAEALRPAPLLAESAMASLGRLNDTLAELQSSQHRTSEVLHSLTGPVELRLVPKAS